jgi:hypothetical protein
MTTTSLDIESNLMVAIFQELDLICFDQEPSATEYLKLCVPHIERLGRVFKFLGLAEASTQSALGWKPTAHLLHIIGKRVVAHPTKASHKQATAKEQKLVESLFQLAGGEAEQYIGDDFVFSVLKGLALLQEDRVGGCKPTSLLQETFEDVFGA